MAAFQKPPPLEIKCTDVRCEDDLHCFKQLKKMTPDQRGHCRACDADRVDWTRLHRRDPEDIGHTFKSLQHELIRHHFFNREIDDGAIRHAQRKGRHLLREAVRHRLEKYLAPEQPPRDGFQTPLQGNTIYYAQHATATCCRTCLEYWHNIPKGRDLDEDEFEYCVHLVEVFLDRRLPALADDPIKVPRRKKRPSAEEDG